jgi:hypothetical protein
MTTTKNRAQMKSVRDFLLKLPEPSPDPVILRYDRALLARSSVNRYSLRILPGRGEKQRLADRGTDGVGLKRLGYQKCWLGPLAG